MSLKHFHIFFIALALGLLAFTAYWAHTNDFHGMAVVSALGFLAGLPYSGWYLKKSRAFK